jgi:hypothetical protein
LYQEANFVQFLDAEDRMRSFFLVVSSVATLAAGVAHADVIADRQAIMKDMGRSVWTACTDGQR